MLEAGVVVGIPAATESELPHSMRPTNYSDDLASLKADLLRSVHEPSYHS